MHFFTEFSPLQRKMFDPGSKVTCGTYHLHSIIVKVFGRYFIRVISSEKTHVLIPTSEFAALIPLKRM